MSSTTIKLGDRAKDKISGFAGIVVARTAWLHGCVRITLQPEKLGEDGKVIPNDTFDEAQLALVEADVHQRSPEFTPAGDRQNIGRASDPR